MRSYHYSISLAHRFMAAALLCVLLLPLCTVISFADSSDDRVVRIGYVGTGGVVDENGNNYSGYVVDYLNKVSKYTD